MNNREGKCSESTLRSASNRYNASWPLGLRENVRSDRELGPGIKKGEGKKERKENS
jgi:hypothetical protein